MVCNPMSGNVLKACQYGKEPAAHLIRGLGLLGARSKPKLFAFRDLPDAVSQRLFDFRQRIAVRYVPLNIKADICNIRHSESAQSLPEPIDGRYRKPVHSNKQ